MPITFTPVTDNVDYPKAADINELQNAIVAIRNEIFDNFGFGITTGDMLYYNGTGYIPLISGTAGYILQTQGASAPIWRPRIRCGSETSSATPTINTDNYDCFTLTAQAEDITSMTTNLTGNPKEDDRLHIIIVPTASWLIAWGAKFEDGGSALPEGTNGTERLDVVCIWNVVSNKWRCMYASSAP